jgi:hypothetical protein
MTHDERIEAMARAIWFYSEHAFSYERQKEYWDAIARFALAAAGVEKLEAELAEARRDVERLDYIERRFHTLGFTLGDTWMSAHYTDDPRHKCYSSMREAIDAARGEK